MRLRLKVLKGKPRGHCFVLPNGKFVFGRGPECDVRTNSDLISRQHCLVQVTDDYAFIRDLGSRNGTLIFGELVVGERILVHGDTLQLGPLMLQVILHAPSKDEDFSMGETILVDQEETRTHEAEFKFEPSRTSIK